MSLTEQQRKYAEARMAGHSKKDAAMAAGCPEKTAAQAGSRLEKHPNVAAHLARLKALEAETVPGAGRDAQLPQGGGGNSVFFEDPKDLLRHAMNDRALDMKTRMEAAKALMPFEHQKLGETGKKEQKESAAEGVVKGRFAPAAPPRQLKLVQ